MILCGGAIGSPQLLQLSGIGASSDLEALGIRTIVDLPGVGSNLQDHLEVYIQHECKQPVSIAPWLKHRHKPRIGAEWLFLRSGVGASNHFEAGGFIRSNDTSTTPTRCSTSCRSRSGMTGRSPPPSTATRCTSDRCTPTAAAP